MGTFILKNKSSMFLSLMSVRLYTTLRLLQLCSTCRKHRLPLPPAQFLFAFWPLRFTVSLSS